MASNIGKLVVSLTANTSSFNKGMRRASYRLKAVSRDARALTLAFGAMTTAVAVVAAPLIRAAAQAEEVRNKFEAVFKEMTDTSSAWAKQFAEDTGFATTAIMQWMATLQDTFVPMGIARDEAARLSAQMTQLAGDLASFSNLDPAQVIMDLQSALVGNHETMRKYGVVITETTLKEAAYAAGIAQLGKALTNEEKLLARVSIIMGGTADAQGDLARTSESFTNIVRKLNGQWENLKEALGTPIMNVLTPHVERLAEVVKATTEWADENKTLIKVVAGVAGAVVALTGVVAALAAAVWAVTAALAVLAAHPLVAVGIGLAALVAAGASAIGIMSALSDETEVTANEMYLLAIQADEAAAALGDSAGASDDLADGLQDVADNAIEAGKGLTQMQDSLTRALQGELAPIFRDPAGMILEAEAELEHLKERLDGLWERQEWARAGRGVLDPVLAEAAIAERARMIEQVAAQYGAVEAQLRLGQAWIQRMYGTDPGGPGAGYGDAERGGGPRRRPRGGPAALERGTVGAYSAVVGQYYRQAERHAERTARNTERANEIATQIRDKIEAPPDLQNAPM